MSFLTLCLQAPGVLRGDCAEWGLCSGKDDDPALTQGASGPASLAWGLHVQGPPGLETLQLWWPLHRCCGLLPHRPWSPPYLVQGLLDSTP